MAIDKEHIAQLLVRWERAETTEQEETWLSEQLRTIRPLPKEWQPYATLMADIEAGAARLTDAELDALEAKSADGKEEADNGSKARTRHSYLSIIGYAAAAIILLALLLPQLFKETARQEETPKLIAKADSTRTQRMDSTVTDKGIPEHVIRDIERIKHKTPRHLMAQNKAKTQKPSEVKDTQTDKQETQTKSQSEQKRKRTIEDYIDTNPPQNLSSDFNGLTVKEILAVKAQQDEEELQDIRRRGKQLEKMMAVIPDLY